MILPDILTTQENATNGVLIVLLPSFAESGKTRVRSFLSDRTLDLGKTLNHFCEWFPLWGIPFARTSGQESAFERSFFAFTWPDTMPTNAHGPQLIPKIAEHASELNAVLEQRKPQLVIFLSCYLWQAMNAQAEVFLSTAGKPIDAGRRISNTRLAAYFQRWENLCAVALPIPGKNTTENFVISLAPMLQTVFQNIGKLPTNVQDPLLQQAAEVLILDRDASIQSIRSKLHVNKERAEELFDALKNRAYDTDKTGRALCKKIQLT